MILEYVLKFMKWGGQNKGKVYKKNIFCNSDIYGNGVATFL